MRPRGRNAAKLIGIMDELNAPADTNWLLARLVLSDKIKDSRIDIETKWTLSDVLEAHEWLDLAEDMAVIVERRLAVDR